MDVGVWLRNLGLGQYEHRFRDSKIDVDVLADLTDGDLEKLGLPLGDRKRLLRAIATLASPEQPLTQARHAAAAPLPPLAVPGVPPVTIPPADPFDLAALGRDIRREIRKQRRRGPGTRVVTPPPTPPSTPPAAPAAAPTAPPPAHASSPSSPASPASPSDPEPFPTDGTVTILFCDMVDYAGMTERLGDQVSRDLLRDHHRIVREALSRYGGREMKVQGDGFMLAFGGAARALRCAMDIQRAVAGYIPPAAGERIAVHIGIHTGDAVDEGDDYLGLTVIVASRLADAAGPGEILVSSLSEQLVAGSGEFTFAGQRETPLKGMERAQLSATLSWA